LECTGKGSRAVALFSFTLGVYDVLKHLLFLCPEFFSCSFSDKNNRELRKTGLK